MLYINGQWKESVSKETMEVSNPATGESIKKVSKAAKEDVEEAIQSAKSAFKEWKNKPAKERAEILMKATHYLRDNADDIAYQLTEEMGKPIKESKGEVQLGSDYFEWYAGEAVRIYGDVIPSSSSSKRLQVIKEPVGVVAAITPWNFPIAMIARKVAPALAAGCPVIIKAASATPLSAISVVEALVKAGVPKGVVNLVSGSAQTIIEPIMESSAVRKVTFTGSTEVGKKLIEQSAKTVKKMSMELGGHAPYIIFEDADLDTAVDGVVKSKFRNAGQTCVCTNRIYVHESIEKEFIDKFVKEVKKLKVGNGLDETTDIGPMINMDALEKAEEHIEDAKQNGGEVVYGGNRTKNMGSENFFEPTIIKKANEKMLIATEETFGPVAPVFTFKTEEEAIQRANHKEYGLAAYFFTNNLNRSYRVTEQLEYGIVGVNDPIPTTAQAPFGGVKESGIGREGGKEGILDYLESKFVSVGDIN